MEPISLFCNEGGTNLIVKTAGNACNIDCKYCFEKVKDVDSGKISPVVLRQIIEMAQYPCSIVMHGGEPLIVGVKYFDELLTVINDYFPQKVNIVRIQTNGTLLNQEWIDLLFKKYKHLEIEIAISLDGTPCMNALRVDNNGRPTFAATRKAFSLLEENGQKAGLLSVISKYALNNAKEYIDFLSTIPNLSFVKLNALFNVENNALTDDSITPTEYSTFIIEASRYYIQSGLYTRFAMEPLLSILQVLKGKKSRYCNYSGRKCYNYVSLYPDGTLGPCDCLSVNRFPIQLEQGKKMDENIIQSLKSGSVKELYKLISQCRDCDIREFCMGGCLSQRFYFSQNIALLEDFCASKHMLYNEFKKIFKK